MGQQKPIGSLLFSRPKPPGKKIHGFLRLPGELRNRVYDYYFKNEFRVEIVARGTVLVKPKPKTVKLYVSPRYDHVKTRTPLADVPSNFLRMSRTMGRYKHVDGIETKWASSLSALPLVSKQIYAETVSYLYLNTTFVFDAPRRLTNFIESVPAINLSHVTKLILHYSTYGDPRYKNPFQEKHVKSWTTACEVASKSLTNLQRLEVFFNHNGNELVFSNGNRYIQPLLQFRRLSSTPVSNKPAHSTSATETSNRLSTVIVHFSTRNTRRSYENAYLKEVSSGLLDLYGVAISRAILGWKKHDVV